MYYDNPRNLHEQVGERKYKKIKAFFSVQQKRKYIEIEAVKSVQKSVREEREGEKY